MSDVTRWWWIRHAPVPDGGRIYGQGDVDCDCGDTEIFRILARELPRKAVWLTSNLKRTTQTAQAILAADGGKRFSGVQLRAIPEFAEQHLGEWQGQERKAFYAARKVGTHTLWFAPASERPQGGESFEDLMQRVVPAIERLNTEHRGQDIVAVLELGRFPGIVLGVRKDKAASVKSFKDLKGLKIGVTAPGSSTHFFVNALIAKEGLKAFGEKRKPAWPGK